MRQNLSGSIGRTFRRQGKFTYIAEVDDGGHAGFQNYSELKVAVAYVQCIEGASFIVNARPGARRLTTSRFNAVRRSLATA